MLLVRPPAATMLEVVGDVVSLCSPGTFAHNFAAAKIEELAEVARAELENNGRPRKSKSNFTARMRKLELWSPLRESLLRQAC